MKKNPRSRPATQADVERARREGPGHDLPYCHFKVKIRAAELLEEAGHERKTQQLPQRRI